MTKSNNNTNNTNNTNNNNEEEILMGKSNVKVYATHITFNNGGNSFQTVRAIAKDELTILLERIGGEKNLILEEIETTTGKKFTSFTKQTVIVQNINKDGFKSNFNKIYVSGNGKETMMGVEVEKIIYNATSKGDMGRASFYDISVEEEVTTETLKDNVIVYTLEDIIFRNIHKEIEIDFNKVNKEAHNFKSKMDAMSMNKNVSREELIELRVNEALSSSLEAHIVYNNKVVRILKTKEFGLLTESITTGNYQHFMPEFKQGLVLNAISHDELTQITTFNLGKLSKLTTRIELENMITRSIHPKGNKQKHLKLVSTGDKFGNKAEVQLVSINSSRMLRRGAEHFTFGPQNISIKSAILNVESFTRTLMLLQINSEEYYLADGIFVIYDEGKTTMVREVKENDGSHYVDIINNVSIEKSLLMDKNEKIHDHVSLYKALAWTPSGLRDAQVIMVDVSKGEEIIESLIDHTSVGAMILWEGKEFGFADYIKNFQARVMQGGTQSADFGRLDAIGLYNGKFLGEDGVQIVDGHAWFRTEAGHKAFEKVTGKTVDIKSLKGLMVQYRPAQSKVAGKTVNDDFVEELMSCYDTIRFTETEAAKNIKVIEGFNLKGFTKEEIENLTEEQCKQYLKVTKEEVNLSLMLKDKLIIIRRDDLPESTLPDFITDNNGMKTKYDFTQGANLEILAVSKAGKLRGSLPLLEKAFAIDPERTKEVVDYIYHNQLADKGEKAIFNTEVQIPTHEEVNATWVHQALKKAAPKMFLNDKAMFKSIVTPEIQTQSNMIHKLQIPLAGYNLTLGCEITELFHSQGARRVLKMNEALAPAIEKEIKRKLNTLPELIQEAKDQIVDIKFGQEEQDIKDFKLKNLEKALAMLESELEGRKNGNNEVVLIKYPTIGCKEFLVVKVISIEEFCSRIDAQEISESTKNAIKGYMREHSEGCITISNAPEIVNTLAGSDFDFDAASVILEYHLAQIFVKEVKENGITITKIDDMDRKIAKVNSMSIQNTTSMRNKSNLRPCVSEDTSSVFKYLISNSGMGIGEITNTNSAIVAMIIMAKKAKTSKDEKLQATLVKVFKKVFKGGNKAYNELKYNIGRDNPEDYNVDGMKAKEYVISENIADRLFESMKQMELTLENITKALYDLNIIARLYQETAIDGVKKAIILIVNELFSTLSKTVSAKSLNEINFVADWSKNSFESVEYTNDKKIEIEDILFETKQTAKNEFLDNFKTLLEADIKLSDEMTSILTASIVGVPKEIITSLTEIKGIYNKLCAIQVQLAKESDSDEYSEHLKLISDNQMYFLTQQVRTLLKGYSPVQAGNIMNYIAHTNKQGLYAASTNRFASRLTKEELSLSIYNLPGSMNRCGYEVIVKKIGKGKDKKAAHNVGDVLFFIDGMCGDNARLVNSDFTGELEITEFNGKLYATDLVQNVVEIPEATEDLGSVRVKITSNEEETRKLAELIKSAKNVSLSGFKVIADGIHIADIQTETGKVDQKAFLNIIKGSINVKEVVYMNNMEGNITDNMVVLFEFDRTREEQEEISKEEKVEVFTSNDDSL